LMAAREALGGMAMTPSLARLVKCVCVRAVVRGSIRVRETGAVDISVS
jgi:hypothetical protein